MLQHFNINASLIRLDQHNEQQHVEAMVSLLTKGQDMALVSDAGTPTISDPGHYFIQALVERDINIIPIPGPCSVSTLLSAAGIYLPQYHFAGFFPRKVGEATTLIHLVKSYNCPIVFLESPKRIEKTLQLLTDIAPDSYCVVAKELTKTFETFFRGNPATIKSQLATTLIKGEWCFVIRFAEVDTATTINKPFLDQAKQLGLSSKSILSLTKTLGYNKNQVYDYLIDTND